MQHDLINEEVIKNIVKEVVSGYQTMPPKKTGQNDVEVLVEASGRHVHLSQQDIERLFGKGYKLTPKKNLSQIGQFASEERVTLIGPKNIYRNVAVLGPARKETQVEISLSDARFLSDLQRIFLPCTRIPQSSCPRQRCCTDKLVQACLHKSCQALRVQFFHFYIQ